MKNYNKILEAIDNGILLALDDFDDEVLVLHIKSKQVLNRDYTKEYLDLMEKVVDLGLPSGTLWCKYNLGANLPKNPGYYYAWGETNPKNKYVQFNYLFSSANNFTKYNNIDNLTKLTLEDNAAFQYDYRMTIPTYAQIKELFDYTKINVVENGIELCANNLQLFIPAAGYKKEYYNEDIGKSIFIWSSTLDKDNNKYAMCFGYNRYTLKIYNHLIRYLGMPIRPVLNLN